MITHALFRNTFPIIIMLVYLIIRKYKLDLEIYYKILIISIYSIIPIIFILSFIGYNPISFVLSNSWELNYNLNEYLIFFIIISILLYIKTFRYSYTFTTSFISLIAIGYLYEIPNWLYHYGLKGIIRTSKNSVYILDIDMISLIFLIFLFLEYRIKNKKLILISFIFYLFCCIIFYLYYPSLDKYIYFMYHIPKLIIRRIPSFIFICSICLSLGDKNDIYAK